MVGYSKYILYHNYYRFLLLIVWMVFRVRRTSTCFPSFRMMFKEQSERI